MITFLFVLGIITAALGLPILCCMALLNMLESRPALFHVKGEAKTPTPQVQRKFTVVRGGKR